MEIVIKKTLIKTVIIFAAVLLVFSLGCTGVHAEQKQEKKVSIKVSYYESGAVFFTDYDVDFYIDKKFVETIKPGTIFQKKISLTKGEHTVYFVATKKIKTSQKLNITDEKYVVYSLYSSSYDDYVKAYRCKTDMDIITMEDHPKLLDDIDTAYDSWEDYDNKRVALEDNNTDPVFPENIIASVECNDYDRIDDFSIYVSGIDGIEKQVHDAKSAVKFARKYVNMKKLKKYYDSGESYKVFYHDEESDNDWRRYVIHYNANKKGHKKHYPEDIYIEIEKESADGPVTDICMWWRGKPGSSWGSNYHVYKDWEMRL